MRVQRWHETAGDAQVTDKDEDKEEEEEKGMDEARISKRNEGLQ